MGYSFCFGLFSLNYDRTVLNRITGWTHNLLTFYAQNKYMISINGLNHASRIYNSVCPLPFIYFSYKEVLWMQTFKLNFFELLFWLFFLKLKLWTPNTKRSIKMTLAFKFNRIINTFETFEISNFILQYEISFYRYFERY